MKMLAREVNGSAKSIKYDLLGRKHISSPSNRKKNIHTQKCSKAKVLIVHEHIVELAIDNQSHSS
jgi:hypothetical protein